MKTGYVMIAILALAGFAAVPGMAVDTTTGCCPNVCDTGGECQGGAWQTSPLPNGCCPTLETITQTPEWERCGTFCQAGQTPPGWPYGWCDEYWLRPDSNY